jgi:hypothetical protein
MTTQMIEKAMQGDRGESLRWHYLFTVRANYSRAGQMTPLATVHSWIGSVAPEELTPPTQTKVFDISEMLPQPSFGVHGPVTAFLI